MNILKDLQVKCNWSISNNNSNSNSNSNNNNSNNNNSNNSNTKDKNIIDYIIFFINDDDQFNIPDQPIQLVKGECQDSFQLDLKLSNSNLIKIQSIYIESQSRVQEFSIHSSKEYIGTEKSLLIQDSNPKLYSTEYILQSNVPPTTHLYIKFLSLLNKESILISKIIIDCKITELIANQPINHNGINSSDNSNSNSNSNNKPIPSPNPNDVNNLLSLMSMLKSPNSTGHSSNPMPQNQFNPMMMIPPKPFVNPTQPSPLVLQQSAQHQLNNQEIKKSILESESRIMNYMEKKFQLIFDKMEQLEYKINKINNNNNNIQQQNYNINNNNNNIQQNNNHNIEQTQSNNNIQQNNNQNNDDSNKNQE